jgi:hypothetical protein
MAGVWNTDFLRVAPLFEVLRPLLARLSPPAGSWPDLDDFQQWVDASPAPIVTGGGAPLRIVPPSDAGLADWRAGYEPRTYLNGELQTRSENEHDLFNLLVWLSFPRTKVALNARHYRLLHGRQGQGAQPRNPAQDALTQFDETGVVIACAEPELEELLRGFRWKELFWSRREEVRAQMACYLFGHGLMEKALAPYRGMTGKGLLVTVTDSFFSLPLAERIEQLDATLAGRLAGADYLARPADLAPVPALGFPGFTQENEQEAYYDDQSYFRPGRGKALTRP